MRSEGTSGAAKGGLNSYGFDQRFGSAKLAAAATGVLKLTLFLALLFVAALAAQAQTERVLYVFTGGSDGRLPRSSLTSDGVGNFYGTTQQGGVAGSAGTVFKLSPDGSGGWKETVLYSFCSAQNCVDGAYPMGSVILDPMGNLYGTTTASGANGYGVVFELSPVGTSWTETVLYSFKGGADGAYPQTSLIMDPAGNLYGTTTGGGTGPSGGTVFELSPSGGGWTEQVIYNLANAGSTLAGLTMDAAGNIFGTSTSTVFELSPNGSGGWTPTVLHTFAGSPDDLEGTPVFDLAGNLYGTTEHGGAYGHGLVYELSRGQTGKWIEKTLYSFGSSSSDGTEPFGGVVFDVGGNVYGTTTSGGEFGYGTVFELVPPVGTGSYQEKVILSFNFTDGREPFDSLLDSAGNLYGTAAGGGSSNGAGVVFEVELPYVKPATTITLSSSLNPSVYGQTVAFTAVVTSSLGAPPDGETVTFKKGATVLGTGAMGGGSASFTTSTLPVANNPITAVYSGDAKFVGSTSKVVKQVITRATTATTLASSLNPSKVGQAVTFTATVTPQFSGTVKGSVSFYDGTTLLKTVAPSSGKAKFTISTLAQGSHTITGTYNGSTNFIGSSAAVTQQVN